jgi:predicted NUDIX family NTP pyrophosphohydrolase
MSSLRSAALLVYRQRAGQIEFLLAHPGGPYWRRRDAGVWSIPKGLIETGEDAAAAARREFCEETGLAAPEALEALTPCRQPSGKLVLTWLAEADLNVSRARSNLFELEWPPGSARRLQYPEVDRMAYFGLARALEKILAGQAPILREAADRIRKRREAP